MRTLLIRTALISAAGFGLLLIWIVLGQRAAESLRGQERSGLNFANVECEPPPSLTREEFLGEVSYLAGLDDRLSFQEPDLARRLAYAFAAHPWVASVQRVEVLPRATRVHLTYREAVLVVTWAEGMRAVDQEGVLLPTAATLSTLPHFEGEPVASPRGVGQPWGEARVQRAAKVAALVAPHRAAFPVEKVRVTDEGISLLAGAHKIVWGSAPGEEKAGEASAEQKIQRLSALSAADLARSNLDLRTPTK